MVRARSKTRIIRATINENWFRGVMSDRGITGASIAKQMRLDPSAFNRRLTGYLEFSADEAVLLSRILGVPLEDVLENLGIKAADVTRSVKALVVGWVAGDLLVHTDGGLRGSRTVPMPTGGAKNVVALRFQTSGTALESFDGMIAYYAPADEVMRGVAGRWCVVGLDDKRIVIGTVRPGYTKGSYNIEGGGSIISDAWVKWASPILLAQF